MLMTLPVRELMTYPLQQQSTIHKDPLKFRASTQHCFCSHGDCFSIPCWIYLCRLGCSEALQNVCLGAP